MIKKSWYEVVAPEMMGEKPICELPAVEPQALVGRRLSVSLLDILPEYGSKFFIKLNFKITDFNGKAKTKFVGHDVMYERIYRMVQRHSRRVDAVQDVITKDGLKLRVKTVLIIPRRVGTSTKDAVRKKLAETVNVLVSDMTVEEFVKSIVTDNLQIKIKEACTKVYPVGSVEIRKSEVIENAQKQKKKE